LETVQDKDVVAMKY